MKWVGAFQHTMAYPSDAQQNQTIRGSGSNLHKWYQVMGQIKTVSNEYHFRKCMQWTNWKPLFLINVWFFWLCLSKREVQFLMNQMEKYNLFKNSIKKQILFIDMRNLCNTNYLWVLNPHKTSDSLLKDGKFKYFTSIIITGFNTKMLKKKKKTIKNRGLNLIPRLPWIRKILSFKNKQFQLAWLRKD